MFIITTVCGVVRGGGGEGCFGLGVFGVFFWWKTSFMVGCFGCFFLVEDFVYGR